MAQTLRIASFNVENLFRRARIINLQDSERIRKLLNNYAELSAIGAKKHYSANNKADILTLLKDLKGFVKLNEFSGRLVNRRRTKVVADGSDDWFGSFDLVKQRFNETTRKNTARVIKDVNADILCVIEAEDRLTLEKFATDRLKSTTKFKRYPFTMLVDGNDNRGIDVGIYSRYPIRGLRTNLRDDDGTKSVFSRDCLEVKVDVGADRPICLLINHLKSKGFGTQADNDRKRKAQANAIADIIGARYDISNDYIVVAGDLNDTPDSAPLQPVIGLNGLHDPLESQFGNDNTQRWTYSFRNQLNQIDYLLVSTPLSDKLAQAGVERRGIFEIDKITNGAVKRYNTITRPTEAASDHGAVWADFTFAALG